MVRYRTYKGNIGLEVWLNTAELREFFQCCACGHEGIDRTHRIRIAEADAAEANSLSRRAAARIVAC